MIQVHHPSQIGEIVESQTPGHGDDRPSKRRHITDGPIDIEDDEEDDHGDDQEGVEPGQMGNGMWVKTTMEVPESECDFTSIQELRREVRKRENPGQSPFLLLLLLPSSFFSLPPDSQPYLQSHIRSGSEFCLSQARQVVCLDKIYGKVTDRAEVKEIMLKHAFVGLVDLSYGLSLIQHSTRLFLADHTTLAYVQTPALCFTPPLIRGFIPR